MKKRIQKALATLLSLALLAAALPAQAPDKQTQQPAEPSGFRMRVTAELVLVNVTVKDKDGRFVRNLTRDDFTLLEDGKSQAVSSFDVEDIDALAAAPPAVESGPSQSAILKAPKSPTPAEAAAAPPSLKDRRILVLFFDTSGMEPDEIERAGAAAMNYVDKQMSPADLVGVVSFSTSMKVEQDFTADRDLLRRALVRVSPSLGQGLEAGSTGDTEDTPDTAQGFTPDETEYNIFNTDRKLEALQSLAKALGRFEQRKSIVYFSSGVTRTGIENQSQLRAAVNAAVQANVSIYSVDIRGLQALPPGGDATRASLRGTGLYSGQAVRGQFAENFGSQETLVTLASDTGGRAFTDTNDFGRVFERIQQDTAHYYVLGYRSNNPARDGRYRSISVKLKPAGYKMEHRRGYYAPRDFAHASREDREEQLQNELAAELPSTDLNVFLAASFFRLDDARYFVPVSVVIPGWEIPFTRSSDKDKATLDIAGIVRDDALRRVVGQARETVHLNLDESQQVRRKNVQYTTGFTLLPGAYHLRFVVRENQSGRIGAFETELTVPDLKKSPLRVSSVLMASQLNAAPKKTGSPLVRDGQEVVPNITHVFSSSQKLYFYYEVYDPARVAGAKEKTAVRVLTNIAFFNGKVKAYETPLVEAREVNTPERRAAVFQFEVPLAQLRPGFYTCQVNVVDDAAGTFVFPRLALLVRQ